MSERTLIKEWVDNWYRTGKSWFSYSLETQATGLPDEWQDFLTTKTRSTDKDALTNEFIDYVMARRSKLHKVLK